METLNLPVETSMHMKLHDFHVQKVPADNITKVIKNNILTNKIASFKFYRVKK